MRKLYAYANTKFPEEIYVLKGTCEALATTFWGMVADYETFFMLQTQLSKFKLFINTFNEIPIY